MNQYDHLRRNVVEAKVLADALDHLLKNIASELRKGADNPEHHASLAQTLDDRSPDLIADVFSGTPMVIGTFAEQAKKAPEPDPRFVTPKAKA